MPKNEDAREVKRFEKGEGKPKDGYQGKAKTGKPSKIATTMQMRSKFGNTGMGMGNSGVMEGSGGNFYSPELSTDFLELPQSLHEAWNYYRFFYRTEPFVGQAIDLHTELPLSKIRIGVPKAVDRDLATSATRYCEKWARRVSLLRCLLYIVHDLNLIGEVNIWVEDNNPEEPDSLRWETVRAVTPDGELVEQKVEREDGVERAVKWLKKNYKGWTALRVLPPEQVRMESFNFTDEKIFELIPDSKTKDIINKAQQGDNEATRVVESMPPDVVDAVASGKNIPLNTDPDAGSFVYYMANKKSQYEPRGHSILERCLLPGTLITVLRGNNIIQVPVEDVDVSTDLLLTHKGRFRKAGKGSRPVSEDVTVLHVEGIKPIALTSDHPVLVIGERGGSESWVHAGDIKPGDIVREAHPIPKDGYPEIIDLAEWWKDKGTFTVSRRVRPNEKGLEIAEREIRVACVNVDEDGYLVTFEHDQDDAGRVATIKTDRKLTTWLKGLTEPTTASYVAVATITGLSKMDVCHAVRRFERDVPSFKRVTEGRQSVWSPLPEDARVPGEVMFRSETSSVRQIKVTEDFAYLLGTWIGDGSFWTSDERFLNTACLSWSIDERDDETRNRILDLCREFFGPDNVEVGNLFGESEDAGTLNVRVEDVMLSRWFHDEFGHSAQSKRVPKWVFDLPEGHVLAFLRGVLDTDGHLQMSRNTIDIQIDNQALIRQIHLLCNRVGIKTQVKPTHRKARSWTRRWKTAKGWKEKTYEYEPKTFWRLTASRHDEIRKWAQEGSIKGGRVEWPEKNHSWSSSFREGWLTREVKFIETVAYQGLVYSFDVEDDESLTAGCVIVHNCIRVLVFRDKLRQANTSIASRHMTPIRIVWGENMDATDVENLREQVDVALQDPDFSIIANFEIRWEEMGSDQRLLDLTSEYDMTDRQLYAGLGVTEGLLSGESAYSGDRINLEVINTRYMLLRELIQEFVEEQLFKPMCARMGFIEIDKDDGEEVVVTPRLSFTRLALRDNNDTFDALYNLYTKGSLDIDVILELLNIDPVATREKLERDIMTVNDAQFNEVLRGTYGDVGRKLAENSNATAKIAKYLGLNYEEPKEEGGGRY